MGGIAGFILGFFSLLFFYPDYSPNKRSEINEQKASKQIIKKKGKKKNHEAKTR